MIQSIQIQSRVGSDGVLSLRVPLNPDDADSEVLITIEPVAKIAANQVAAKDAWHQFVESAYGSCAGLGLREIR